MQQKIPTGLSLYLEAVRFVAAVCVVLYHTWGSFFPGSNIKWPGHEAVVVFFVLSGYVISHAAARPGVTWLTYTEHRLARILPVAYLSLLLALVVAPFLADGKFDSLWGDTVANSLFIAHSGMAFIEAPLNSPFWSLNYEVWYYIIFGCWAFSAKKWRIPLTAAALLAAGPKILLLFPVWLYGVLLYRAMPKFGARAAAVIFSVTVVLGALLTWLDVSDDIRTWLYTVFPPAWHAHYSTQFIYDILLGAVVFLNFSAVASMETRPGGFALIGRPIRYLAGFTFSIYVFHSILFVAITRLFKVESAVACYALMAACIFVFAQITERRTQFYRSVFRLILYGFFPARRPRVL